MPATAARPFPTHEAFEPTREMLVDAKRSMSDAAYLELCAATRREWSDLADLVTADPGFPAKKLTVPQRAAKRGLDRRNITAADIADLLAWIDAEVASVRLKHVRAA